METVTVALGERSYPIYIGSKILAEFGATLKRFTESRKVAVVTNPTVAALYLDVVAESLKKSGFECLVIEIPDGERYKSLEWAGRIFDKLISGRADRYSPVIALGGGVVGDITGFAAATYLRGVPFVQVPTTLLAQVDSSVGGKTAVNHPKGKNLIGAFYQPKLVYIDIDTLRTLDPREIRAGLAEVIKYGVIKDAELFRYLEENIEEILNRNTGYKIRNTKLIHIVKRSCEIKAEVVAADEREAGLRAILNFGHTYGHAIEAVTEYKEYKHGEAVGIGMLIATKIAMEEGMCDNKLYMRLRKLIQETGLPVEATGLSKEALMQAVSLDKKVVRDEVRFVLPKKIGEVELRKVDAKRIKSVF